MIKNFIIFINNENLNPFIYAMIKIYICEIKKYNGKIEKIKI